MIECGTCAGGSALYLAMLLDLIGRGEVITVDIAPRPGLPEHPRITLRHRLEHGPRGRGRHPGAGSDTGARW